MWIEKVKDIPWKNSKVQLISWITLAVIIFGLLILLISNTNKKSTIVKLQAKLVYNEKKFEITNSDTMDFINAELAINEYYKIRNINLKKGEAYTIGR